jgi:hypothetical protein
MRVVKFKNEDIKTNLFHINLIILYRKTTYQYFNTLG